MDPTSLYSTNFESSSSNQTIDWDYIYNTAIENGLGEGIGLEMNSYYFSITDFFVDQSMIDVVTLQICPFSGFVDSNNKGNDIHLPKGRKLQVPLAAAVVLHEKKLVQIIVPSIYNESVLLNLKRNPFIVNVKSLHPYYFELGMKLAAVLQDSDLRQILLNALEERIMCLMELAVEEAENEHRDSLNSGMVISHLKDTSNSENKNNQLHPSKNRISLNTGVDDASALSADVSQFDSHYNSSLKNSSLNIEIFINGLSLPEATVFQQRKEELRLSYSNNIHIM